MFLLKLSLAMFPGRLWRICTALLLCHILLCVCDDPIPKPSVRYFCATERNYSDDLWWLAKLDLRMWLQSTKQNRNSAITATLPTSLERLEVLRVLCKVWPGAVKAAVYVPMVNGTVFSWDAPQLNGLTLMEVQIKVMKMFQGFQENGQCALDMAVYTEELPGTSIWFSYPTNAMRNKALLMVETELVMQLDADFIPGPVTFIEALHDPESATHQEILQILNSNGLVVLPSLDFDGRNEQEKHRHLHQALHGSKQEVRRMAHEDYIVHQFQPSAHGATNFSRWIDTEDMYEIMYNGQPPGQPDQYEPYVVAQTKKLPWFDERLRGYHCNKMSFHYALHKMGFRYFAYPSAYVMHYSHPVRRELKDPEIDNTRAKMETIFYAVMPVEFRYGVYKTYVADESACNRPVQPRM